MHRRDFMKMFGMGVIGASLPGPLLQAAALNSGAGHASYAPLFIEMTEALEQAGEWGLPITEQPMYLEQMQQAVEISQQQSLLGDMKALQNYADPDMGFSPEALREMRQDFQALGKPSDWKQLRQAIAQENQIARHAYGEKLVQESAIPRTRANDIVERLLARDEKLLNESFHVYSMDDVHFEQWVMKQEARMAHVYRLNADIIEQFERGIKTPPADDVNIRDTAPFALQVKISRKLRDHGYNLTVQRSACPDGCIESPQELATRTANMIMNLQEHYADSMVQVENKDFQRGRVVVLTEKDSTIDQFFSNAMAQQQGLARSA